MEDEAEYGNEVSTLLGEDFDAELMEEEELFGEAEVPDETAHVEDGQPNGVDVLVQGEGARPSEERITSPYLTKYELARAVGVRAAQVSMGAPVMVDVGTESDALEIAAMELREKRIPFIIRRYMPGGEYEDWKLEELIIPDR